MGFWSAVFGQGGQHDGTSPLDGHDGGPATDYTGGGNGTHYIEGQKSDRNNLTAIVTLGPSGILNGPDQYPIAEYGEQEPIGTIHGEWGMQDYQDAQDAQSGDYNNCGTW